MIFLDRERILFVLTVTFFKEVCSHATTTISNRDLPPSPEIIWNGCASKAFTRNNYYNNNNNNENNNVEIEIEKPKICETRLPEYLENVRPQKSKCPFLVEAINYESPKSLILAVTAKHNANDGKIKSYKYPKRNSFRALFISAQTLKGQDIGSFTNFDEIQTNDAFKMGYCCGKSRFNQNFYELNIPIGEWTTDVTWDSLNFVGPVVFNVTIVQDRKTYWLVPPFVMNIQ